MINEFKTYNYYTFGADNGYGMPALSVEPQGTVKMSIFLTSQAVQNNINYTSAQYVGLTHSKIDDTYVIEYNSQKLKVLYVNDTGRYTQVFMCKI